MKEPTKTKAADIKVSYTKFENGKAVAYPATSGPAAEPALNNKLKKQARSGVAFVAAGPVRCIAAGEGVQQVNALIGPSEYFLTVNDHNVDGVVVLSPAASHQIIGTADLVICEVEDAKCDKFQVVSGPVAVNGAAFIHYAVGPRQSKTIENSDGSTFFVDAGETAIVGFTA